MACWAAAATACRRAARDPSVVRAGSGRARRHRCGSPSRSTRAIRGFLRDPGPGCSGRRSCSPAFVGAPQTGKKSIATLCYDRSAALFGRARSSGFSLVRSSKPPFTNAPFSPDVRGAAGPSSAADTAMTRLNLRAPDDWHLHLRDGAQLAAVLPYTAAQFRRAVVMPNLVPPVTTTALALAYRERILAALPPGSRFQPLMTLYLTDRTDPGEIARARASGHVLACKLYPAGATTNSDAGVTDIRRIDAVLEAMAQQRMPLLVHGEVTRPDVDVFDREARFIDEVLVPLRARLPSLRIVFEHVTTA